MNRYKFISEGGEHLHTLDGKPLIGTSTIASSIGKGAALSWWASGKACEHLGWIKPIKEEKTFATLNEQERIDSALLNWEIIKKLPSHLSYLDLLDNAYKAHSVKLKKAAKDGIDLHSMLEDYIKFRIEKGMEATADILIPINKGTEILRPFVEWEKNNVKKWLFSELHVYSERLWVGGIIDAGYMDKDDNFVLADFKSGGAWFSGFCQLGGYDLQLLENWGFNSNGDKVYEMPIVNGKINHAIFSFKNGFKEPLIRTNTAANRRAFEYACNLYKEQMDFDKEFQRN